MQLMARFRVKTDLVTVLVSPASSISTFCRANVEDLRDESRKVAADLGVWRRLE